LFNFFHDRVDGLDIKNAVAVRRENLRNYLYCFRKQPKILIVGEAPGPWGARFSGIPFTGEGPLSRGELPFKGKTTSVSPVPYSEYSGNIVWKELAQYFPDFFIWNTIPFHPHKKSQPLSIRSPKQSEINESVHYFETLLTILKPKKIVAVGRVAERAAKAMDCDCLYVRHPSMAGINEFRKGIREIFAE
jgi:uracil-DNA glycosylase